MIQIYPASKARHYLWWKSLRSAGVPIVYPCWVDASSKEDGTEPTHDGWATHWLESLAAEPAGDEHFLASVRFRKAEAMGRLLFSLSFNDSNRDVPPSRAWCSGLEGNPRSKHKWHIRPGSE
jgi:hypothetical protein